ncbi:MAG: PRC-barrel domain containing protein [Croceibacterium sp.]|jgi:hypothetical protein
MRIAPLAALPLLALALSACESEAEREADATEDRIEQQADASAAAAGNAVAALGLTEAQLLDADLVAADGTDLGDIEQIQRDASGAVTGFLVEVENSNPDRYVVVPLAGLTTRVSGNDTDLQATMTAADLGALPAATLDAAATPAAGATASATATATPAP